ncbi:MAG: response regulator [Alphaproteobacteria bacterium]|nr:MAG: response regulator [Alphaproteobacteria bacterium]
MSMTNDTLQDLVEDIKTKSLMRNLEVVTLVLALLNGVLGVAHFYALPADYRLLMVAITEGAALIYFSAWMYLRHRQLSVQAYRALETAIFCLLGAIICMHLVLDGRPDLVTNLALAAIGFGIFSHSKSFLITTNLVFVGLVLGLRFQAILPDAWNHMVFHLLQATLLSLTAFFIRMRVFKSNANGRMKIIQSEQELREANIKLSKSMNDSMAALRRAEQAMKAKSDFLAAISHEIRTPMNGIRVASNLLAGDQSLNGEKRRLAEVVQSSTDILTTILNDILDMSKIESGKLLLDPQPFDLGKLLQSVEEMWRLPMDDKGLAFSVTSNLDEPLWLVGDDVRIRQILFNLLSNALKFTEAGSVSCDVKIRSVAKGSYHLDLAVEDSGIGMAKDYLADLFTPFSQENAAISTRFGGTGLGLAICHELASLMEGSLEVESARGKGSTFTLRLSLTEASMPEPQDEGADSSSERPQVQTQSTVRILVAEDNNLNQELIKLLFSKLGREIDLVENGELAVKACMESQYDVAFLDIKMPVMDGLSCARAIHAQVPADQRPVLVALSANALDSDITASLAAGMSRHLSKPIDFAELKRCLEDIEAGQVGDFSAKAQRIA